MVKVSIYPENDEPENIVNVKKGIISALLVPVLEEEHNRIMVRLFRKDEGQYFEHWIYLSCSSDSMCIHYSVVSYREMSMAGLVCGHYSAIIEYFTFPLFKEYHTWKVPD